MKGFFVFIYGYFDGNARHVSMEYRRSFQIDNDPPLFELPS